MKKKIVVINGSGGKGKDLFVKYCSDFTSVLNISSVDKVKEAANILGWNGEKSEKARLFLARLKFDSTDYNDQPYEYIKRNIDYFKSEELYSILFIHIREPEEIQRVKKDFNCITLLIRNPNVKSINSNKADAEVENYNYDYIIDNDGSKNDLKNKACNFIKIIMEENN